MSKFYDKDRGGFDKGHIVRRDEAKILAKIG